jgi:hypothetical protein
MCTVLLPPGVNTIAVKKCTVSCHIIPYHIISNHDTAPHQNNAHPITWTAIPSYALCLFTVLKFQWNNSGYCEPSWQHMSRCWLSSYFPQELHIWIQGSQGRCLNYWGCASESTKFEDLKNVRTRNLWHTSAERNFLIVTVCNFSNFYLC